MKKTFKSIFTFLMVLVLLAGLAATALAADASITFKGQKDGFEFQPGSDYTATDLFGSFKGVMPGDVLTEEITFKNAATDCDFVNLYMRAVPHGEENPLSEKVAEKETLATMTEFLKQLSMKVWNGETLIFDAKADELGGLQENTPLGTFRTGETAKLKVELSVPIELDNKYANRVGEVDWVFHVEAFNESQLTVRKVWSDGNYLHAGDEITVNLLKDGKVERTQELNAENGWTYTFDRLVEGHVWTVEEAQVPAGYRVSYQTEGNTTTIINSRIYVPTPPNPPVKPTPPEEITVVKQWSGDNAKNRPDSVTITLYDGEKVYDTVRLGDWNDWTYTWKKLDGRGNWQVVETNIPKGYTPSYRVRSDVVTVTNTYSLIDTGQLNWPIYVLAALGAVLLLSGLLMATKRKKGKNA